MEEEGMTTESDSWSSSDSSTRKSDRKRKRKDSSDDHDDEPQCEPPKVNANGSIVDFNLSSLVPHFTCPICSGIYKDPVTITECLHSFCKSCLYSYFATGKEHCPTCKVPLYGDMYSTAMNDRTLETLCDKVLFPTVKERDEIEEKRFYASRGIELKPDQSASTTEAPAPVEEADDELELLLFPDVQADDQHELPQLERSCIKTSRRLKIVHLKKYLLRKLEMPPSLLSSVEIHCNDNPVGNELSLHFIERTMWMTSEPLRLVYRFSEDLF